MSDYKDLLEDLADMASVPSMPFRALHRKIFSEAASAIIEQQNRIAMMQDTISNAEARIAELGAICGEAYQVIGTLSDVCGVFNSDKTQNMLTNLSEQRMIHCDVLPYQIAELERAGAGQGEPIGTVRHYNVGGSGEYHSIQWDGLPPPDGAKIYTAPPADKVRDDAKQIASLILDDPDGGRMQISSEIKTEDNNGMRFTVTNPETGRRFGVYLGMSELTRLTAPQGDQP